MKILKIMKKLSFVKNTREVFRVTLRVPHNCLQHYQSVITTANGSVSKSEQFQTLKRTCLFFGYHCLQKIGFLEISRMDFFFSRVT